MLWRQGDVLIESIEAIPAAAVEERQPVLAASLNSGQRHRVENARTARLYRGLHEGRPTLFLDVLADHARIVHPEHDPITLDRGTYRVWTQREFGEFGHRSVLD